MIGYSTVRFISHVNGRQYTSWNADILSKSVLVPETAALSTYNQNSKNNWNASISWNTTLRKMKSEAILGEKTWQTLV